MLQLTKHHYKILLHKVRKHHEHRERVAESDEAQFGIQNVDGCAWVRWLLCKLLYTTGHTHARCGDIKLWLTFSWASLVTVVVVEQIINATVNSKSFAPLHGIYLLKRKWNFHARHRSFLYDSKCAVLVSGT